MEIKCRIISTVILSVIVGILALEPDLVMAYPEYATVIGIVMLVIREAVKEYGTRIEHYE